MPNILVIAEILDGKVRKSTHSAITFARNAGGTFSILVLGQGAKAAAAEVTGFGAQKVLVCDDAYLANPVVERFAPTVAAVAKNGFDVIAVTASSFGKDLAPRVAAKLGAGYAPDINAVKVDGGKRVYRRPMFAGNAWGYCEIATPVQPGVIGPEAGRYNVEFTVGFYSTPMMDNTRLSNDQRVAVILTDMNQAGAGLSLMYFPGSRASLREKPYYEEILRKLADTVSVH